MNAADRFRFGFRTARRWARRPLRAALLCLLASLAACDKPPPRERQVARIALLPDTPPPPPPPPPKEPPKPQPPDASRPQPVQAPKPLEAPPQPAPLKMEGPAGDAPSAFAAGAVGKDYAGGDPVTTGTGGGGASVTDRGQERFFANTARQALRDEMERHLDTKAGELTAVFAVWFDSDGSIRRFELAPTGNAQADLQLNAALTETSRSVRLPPPAGLIQPLRFKLSLRPLG